MLNLFYIVVAPFKVNLSMVLAESRFDALEDNTDMLDRNQVPSRLLKSFVDYPEATTWCM